MGGSEAFWNGNRETVEMRVDAGAARPARRWPPEPQRCSQCGVYELWLSWVCPGCDDT